jgi:SAM-dependent methyltransferase
VVASLHDHRGREIDFGRTAQDYDRHRPGFPASMYDRLTERGWVAPGMRAVDLGTGTGALALGLAARGIDVVGIDPAAELIDVARARAGAGGLPARFDVGVAESTGLPAGGFDLVAAGQCWWWFDADAALREVRRLLVPEGRVLLAGFAYLPLPGSVAARTEELVLRFNPGWPKAGGSGFHPAWIRDLDRGGCRGVESFSYTEVVEFTAEGWRGRMRACNGTGAALPPEQVEAFDGELSALLAREPPGPLRVLHRVFVVTGSAPR